MKAVNPADYAVYAKYNELTALLRGLEASYPGLLKLTSVGKTRQGRDLWLCTVTNRSTGDASAKPAMYIDGNHHAGEVTGSAACLYTLAYLVGNYGKDDFVTSLLDTRAFYVIPRVSPDGSEVYLTTPHSLRSTPRPWPFGREGDGIYPDDVNGDGKILTMRVPDPDGEFKVSPKDCRLMMRRLPDETGDQYYRVYTEGYVRNYDGVEIAPAAPRWGLDLNRNYPINWGNETKQPGSGPFPLSEMESRSVADFVAQNPNIGAVMSYHTTGGIILRPRCTTSDLDIPSRDLVMYRALGTRGTALTGYPCKSIFEGFTRDKRKPSIGSFLDFAYDHMGILSFATELWDLRKRAGIPDREPGLSGLLSESEEEEDGLKVLSWLDRELEGKGFVPWTQVEHPQLGRVEVGGIDGKFVMTNPPVHLLEQECHKNMLFTLSVASAMPLISIDSVDVKAVGTDVFAITAVVRNAGYMPTSGSEQAVTTKSARPVEVNIAIPDGVLLVNSKPLVELGHLAGRALSANMQSSGGSRKKAAWLVDVSQASTRDITISVDGFRGGKASRKITLT